MTPVLNRAALATEVFDTVFKETDSIEGRLGEDLAYLMSAILKGTVCDWDEGDSPLVEILKTVFTEHHQVWQFIAVEPQERTLASYYYDTLGEVSVPLRTGLSICSGWCDKDDPDKQLAGDYLSVFNAAGQREFYVEAPDLAAWPVEKVRRTLLEFVCACLGVPVP